MSKIIPVINMKGGIGKTTLSVNISYIIARIHSKKVLLVDIDPQFNATQFQNHFLLTCENHFFHEYFSRQ
ncbi:MAG: ParA family protein [Ignavibacteria bacterium]